MIVSVIVFPRWRSPPKQKTDKPVYRQQGKQTPLIMSIKSHFPLSLAYACLGDHRDMFFHLVEPIPMHDLSFCHRIKQTTILADIDLNDEHVAPTTVTAYCCLVVQWRYIVCESGWNDHSGADDNVLVNPP